ncbi:16S rRNA (guanine(966)-N(2))-methyltransferase RsmD [Carnobacterium funditum]|uniref:16S rRNA (guanine(966)-N(2))-methyltransferase RsmD n=1 Tax=Carnobacterium funditum TaxID=2752 RepID=UPI0005556991|nr:16S rRNA (guanine(966)-N(2))-methyltransferase RsmD [Carnobacterium funditum]
MRVISGNYGGRKLKSVPGENTRPTSDKVKESIFNIIGPYFDGGKCLDLFAGSGGLSIEAVSRGMEHAVLIDKDISAIKIIKENIEMTKEKTKFDVYRSDANRGIEMLAAKNNLFDMLFLDPPYFEQEIVKQLEKIMALNLLADRAIIVCEVGRKVDLPNEIGLAKQFRSTVYGASKIVLYEVVSEGDLEND